MVETQARDVPRFTSADLMTLLMIPGLIVGTMVADRIWGFRQPLGASVVLGLAWIGFPGARLIRSATKLMKILVGILGSIAATFGLVLGFYGGWAYGWIPAVVFATLGASFGAWYGMSVAMALHRLWVAASHVPLLWRPSRPSTDP